MCHTTDGSWASLSDLDVEAPSDNKLNLASRATVQFAAIVDVRKERGFEKVGKRFAARHADDMERSIGQRGCWITGTAERAMCELNLISAKAR